jgi:hypothetical protein
VVDAALDARRHDYDVGGLGGHCRAWRFERACPRGGKASQRSEGGKQSCDGPHGKIPLNQVLMLRMPSRGKPAWLLFKVRTFVLNAA